MRSDFGRGTERFIQTVPEPNSYTYSYSYSYGSCHPIATKPDPLHRSIPLLTTVRCSEDRSPGPSDNTPLRIASHRLDSTRIDPTRSTSSLRIESHRSATGGTPPVRTDSSPGKATMAPQRQRQRRTRAPLRGCDTFVAYPPTTPDGCAFFGKNSDRPKGEAQSLRRYSAGRHPPGSTLECTYLSIPQAAETFAVLVSQIDWMWGCEHGANEHGVCIGNEAVWTRVPFEAEPKTGRPASLLLGMDLVRLGLERSRSARSALRTITELLEEHGQGGACAEGDPSFCYHNSFLIADAGEAYVLETAGKHWVAQRWASGGRNLSNGLTIRNAYDLCSEGLEDYARELGLWDGTGPLDFAAVFGEDGPGGLPSEDEDDEDDDTRFGCGRALLEKHSGSGRFGKGDMVAILRDHSSGICMHGGGFETTASMVSELHAGNPGRNTHWTTGPHPCRSEFCRQEILEPPAAEANQGKRNE